MNIMMKMQMMIACVLHFCPLSWSQRAAPARILYAFIRSFFLNISSFFLIDHRFLLNRPVSLKIFTILNSLLCFVRFYIFTSFTRVKKITKHCNSMPFQKITWYFILFSRNTEFAGVSQIQYCPRNLSLEVIFFGMNLTFQCF